MVNVVKAIKERVFFVKLEGVFQPPPRPAYPGIFEDRCREFKNSFINLVQPASPLSRKQYLSRYKGRQLTRYEKAFESLKHRPLALKDSFVNVFLKCEKVNFTAKPNAIPRVISPRHPRYIVSLGQYIMRIEHNVYKTITKVFGARCVFKGLNAHASGRQMREHWDHFVDPVAIPLDASRYDQHVSAQALEFEHSIYRLYFPDDQFFAQMLRWQINNRCFANLPSGRVKYRRRGGRQSGDCNTGLGNCLLMCAKFHGFMNHVGITNYRLANNGDDCVLMFERQDLIRRQDTFGDDLALYFRELGFTMEMGDPVSVFEKIEFCQTQPVYTPDGWIMCRIPQICIPKDCLSLKPLDSFKLAKRWIKSVGMCGMSLSGGVPVLQEFYRCMIQLGGNVKELVGDPTQDTGFARLARGMKRTYSDIDSRTRVSFWRAFGIDPNTQVIIEDLFRQSDVKLDVIMANVRPYINII